MKLQISTPVLVTLIAALLYLAAQQPPRSKREPVERAPKPDKPDSHYNPDGIDKTHSIYQNQSRNLRNVHWIGEN